jgi:hypothetical protein
METEQYAYLYAEFISESVRVDLTGTIASCKTTEKIFKD